MNGRVWLPGRTLLVVGAGALLVDACGGGADAVRVVPVASLAISPSSASLVAGSLRQFAVSPRDASGNVLTGRRVAWSVSPGGSVSIDTAGLLTAIAPGTATVFAMSEGQGISAAVNVLPIPVASVLVTPGATSVIAGNTQQLTATARDVAGNPLVGRFTTWSSSVPNIATVDGLGLLTAVSPGTVQISASSEGQAGSAIVTVTAGGAGPIVTAITPASLQPGTNIAIVGVGFGNTIAANVVTIGGVNAPVVAAAATQLTVSVPCVEGGNAIVRIVSNGVAGVPLTRSVVVTRQTIAVGQAMILTSSAPSVCNELATAGTSARYLVAVFSGSTSQSTQTDFEITGNTPPPGESAIRADVPHVELPHLLAARDRSPRDAETARDLVHFNFLERDRAQFETLQRRAATHSARANRNAASSRMAAPLPTLGDMRSAYYTFTGGCSDTTRVVRGKAIYVGTRSIIWEDSANVVQSSANDALAGYYQRLGQIFDEDQYQSVKNNFGDPLLRDAVTDNDGRIHMVFTQRLNGSGAAAYVTSCDQYPNSVSPGSNFGQYFYGSVPTVATSNLNSTASPDGWFYFMARTVVHEVKHIAALSARVANNAPSFEASWLEEGTARHAEELWVRESLHRVSWKANTGFGSAATNGVFCDFNPADATCNAADPLRRPDYGMRRHFNEIREKLLDPWDWSPYGDATGQSSSTFYQTAWSLVRYTIDRYASSDAAFFRTLVNGTSTGVTNLSATAGVPMDQLIGGWGLALFADDYPGLVAPSPDIQFPTWNMRSIYAGLNALPAWNARWTTAYPIQPTQLTFGSFVSRQTGLRGGAHAFFEISGTASPVQLIGLRSINGSAPSTNLRIAIARLQ